MQCLFRNLIFEIPLTRNNNNNNVNSLRFYLSRAVNVYFRKIIISLHCRSKIVINRRLSNDIKFENINSYTNKEQGMYILKHNRIEM